MMIILEVVFVVTRVFWSVIECWWFVVFQNLECSLPPFTVISVSEVKFFECLRRTCPESGLGQVCKSGLKSLAFGSFGKYVLYVLFEGVLDIRYSVHTKTSGLCVGYYVDYRNSRSGTFWPIFILFLTLII
jgi:hypothetical protein